MAPALGRRTPQKPLTEGRPKRQAVLNRKDNVEIAKGAAKGVAGKKEVAVKKNDKAEKANAPKVSKCLDLAELE